VEHVAIMVADPTEPGTFGFGPYRVWEKFYAVMVFVAC